MPYILRSVQVLINAINQLAACPVHTLYRAYFRKISDLFCRAFIVSILIQIILLINVETPAVSIEEVECFVVERDATLCDRDSIEFSLLELIEFDSQLFTNAEVHLVDYFVPGSALLFSLLTQFPHILLVVDDVEHVEDFWDRLNQLMLVAVA